MVAALRGSIPLAVIVALGACEPPWHPLPQWEETEGSTSEGSSTSGEISGGVTGTVTTMGSSSSASGSSGGTEGEPATTGDEALPPVIVDVTLTPDPIKKNGAIAVSVTTELAEGVRMVVDDGGEVELAPGGGAGTFVGEIAVLTGLWNGPHAAVFAPWTSDLEGEVVARGFTIDLEDPGAKLFWETGDTIGGGTVAAMAVLPNGDVIEFGQRWLAGKSRCYARRRDKGGAWKPTDVVDVMPGVECAPIDMAVTPKGSLVMLAYRTGVDGTRWWIGEMPVWGSAALNRGLGGQDEAGMALAVQASGTVAVCGTAPTQEADGLDAAVWFFEAGEVGVSRAFDYNWPGVILPHTMRETVRDCVFAGDKLVLVGEAFGYHVDAQQDKFDRHFVLEYEVATKVEAWRVATGTVAMQSGATAVTVDGEGKYVTAGYICGPTCDPAAELWTLDPEDGLVWRTPLGELPSKAFGPHDVVWSPAGYAIVALGGTVGDEKAFSVRAFAPFTFEPVWTFSHKEGGLFQMAFALAVGAYGQVYAGGFGAGGYPAVAYIAG